MNKRLVVLTSAIAVVLMSPMVAFAQGNFANLIALANSLKQVLDLLAVVVMALALVFFFWGLTMFILSAGDEEKRSKGKSVMIWGVVAFAVMISVWGLATWLLSAFGVNANTTIAIPKVPNS